MSNDDKTAQYIKDLREGQKRFHKAIRPLFENLYDEARREIKYFAPTVSVSKEEFEAMYPISHKEYKDQYLNIKDPQKLMNTSVFELTKNAILAKPVSESEFMAQKTKIQLSTIVKGDSDE